MTAPSQVLAGWRCRWASSPGDPPRVLVARSPGGREVSIGEVSPTWGGQRWLATLLHPGRQRMYLLGHAERGEEGAARSVVEGWVREHGGTVDPLEPPPAPGRRGETIRAALRQLGHATVAQLLEATGACRRLIQRELRDLASRGEAMAIDHEPHPSGRGRPRAVWMAL